jgi:hypothetical protein
MAIAAPICSNDAAKLGALLDRCGAPSLLLAIGIELLRRRGFVARCLSIPKLASGASGSSRGGNFPPREKAPLPRPRGEVVLIVALANEVRP